VGFKDNLCTLLNAAQKKKQSPQEIGIEAVYKCIASLKRGKTPKISSLTAEHVEFAHPSIVMIVSKLFKIMLNKGLVPDGFGFGLSFPIPKVPNKTVTASVEDFASL